MRESRSRERASAGVDRKFNVRCAELGAPPKG
jgi:hypothetical protein